MLTLHLSANDMSLNAAFLDLSLLSSELVVVVVKLAVRSYN